MSVKKGLKFNDAQEEQKKPANLQLKKLTSQNQSCSTTNSPITTKSAKVSPLKKQQSKTESVLSAKSLDRHQDFNNKMNDFLNNVDTFIDKEQQQTQQVAEKVEKLKHQFEQKFDTKEQGKQLLVKIMFSEKEKKEMVKNFMNDKSKFYTSSASGMSYFQNVALKKKNQDNLD